MNINPGHHAKSDRYGGYCYLNNGAICAKSMLNEPNLRYSKIAILDLDYHAGDGTSNIFEYEPNVLTISIHINPLYDYPFYSSFEETNSENEIENETSANTNPNHNITFEPRCTISEYLVKITKAMEIINNFSPDALIIPFGGDTYKSDLDAIEQNRTQIDISDYSQISNRINLLWSSSKPIIITQEGGYDMEKIADILESFLSGFDEV